jgi:hypothetical protein
MSHTCYLIFPINVTIIFPGNVIKRKFNIYVPLFFINKRDAVNWKTAFEFVSI